MSRSRSKIRTSPWERTCLPYWNLQDEGRLVSLERRVDARASLMVLRRARTKSPKHQCKEQVGPSEQTRSPDDANAALDRIEIPQDMVGRISQLLTPGSSVIVSDYGLSRETGNDTDFIVVMP